MEQKLAKVWADWKIVRPIGEGSFGKVFEIVRKNFGIEEHCALKVISIPSSQAELQSMRNEGMDDASATAYYRGLVEEFVQEIALMSKLKGNINIVGYEDYAVVEHEGEIGWDIFIRMELLTALPNYIRENNFTATDVVKLAIDVCSALEVCHAQRIIHRDIKSDNIFISKNRDFKLGDFGVARTIEKTVSGLSKKGTYTYMAPEVYKGEAYSMNADLYSLGIVMYKMLNHNREPFLPPYPQIISFADKNNALVQRLRGDSFVAPQNASRELGEIILKACAYNPAHRFASATAMKNALSSTLHMTSQSTVLYGSDLAQNRTNNSQSASNSTPNQPTQISENPSVSNHSKTADPNATVALDFGASAFQSNSARQAPVEPPEPKPQYTEPVKPQSATPAQRPDYRDYVENPQTQTAKSKEKVKANSILKVIGWVGILFSIIMAILILPYLGGILRLLLIIGAIALFVSQLLLTLDLAPTTMSIIMLISSLCTISLLNLLTAILYLKSSLAGAK